MPSPSIRPVEGIGTTTKRTLPRYSHESGQLSESQRLPFSRALGPRRHSGSPGLDPQHSERVEESLLLPVRELFPGTAPPWHICCCREGIGPLADLASKRTSVCVGYNLLATALTRPAISFLFQLPRYTPPTTTLAAATTSTKDYACCRT